MHLTRVYLAGPMSGLPDHNYPAFNEGAKKLRDAGCFVLNPAELNPPDVTYRQALAVDLAWIIAHAEMIVLLPGFEKSKGCRIEVDLALTLDIPIMLFNDALQLAQIALAANAEQAANANQPAPEKTAEPLDIEAARALHANLSDSENPDIEMPGSMS